MTTDPEQDRDLRAIAHALVADAPEVAEWDALVSSTPPSALRGRRVTFVAAASVVVIGVGGAVALRDRGPEPTSSMGSTQTSSGSGGSLPDPVSATYEIQPGDLRARIADEHCITVQQLDDANQATPGYDAFFVGLEIVLPPGACEPNGQTSDEGNDDPDSDAVVPTEQTYVVVTGDFLSGIAAAHCVSAEALAEYNDWPEGVGAPLFPNDVIRIPPGACRVDAGQAPVTEADSALAPTLYPVIPQDVVGGESVTGAGFAQTSWSNAPVTRALIGVIEGDRLVEALLVESGPWVNEMAGPGEETTVFDQLAQIYSEGGSPTTRTVVWGQNPVIAVEGSNPMAFLQRASADFVVASSVDGAASITTLELGDLPDGWEVIVEPSPLRRGAVEAGLTTDEGGVGIGVTTENPMLTATVGSFVRVDVNGVPAWQSEADINQVIWQADDATFVTVTADSPEQALTVARSLTFVSVGAWMDTYGVEFPIFPPESPAQAPPTPFETTVP